MKKVLMSLVSVIILLSVTACNTGGASSETSDRHSTDSASSQSTGSSAGSSGSTSSSSSTSGSGSTSSSSSSSSTSSSSSSSTTSSSSSSTSSTVVESSDPPVESTVPVHEHQYSGETVDPTCTSDGYTIYTCSCGDRYTADIIGAFGHSYTQSVVNATCTEDGYTVNTCTRCNAQYTSDTIYAAGHSWGDWVTVTEPTIYSEGEQISECAVCGERQSKSLPKVKEFSSFAAEVVNIVNAERAKEGLSPLSESAELSSYAELRSSELVSNFAHERPDGSSPLNYVMAMDGIRMSGENIAMGYRSPEEVMDGWMNSPGHHANIMNSSFSMIGVGCYEYNGSLYWTQIFAG